MLTRPGMTWMAQVAPWARLPESTTSHCGLLGSSLVTRSLPVA